MDSRVLLRHLLQTPCASRSLLSPPIRPHSRNFTHFAPALPQQRYLSLPRIIQPSFWASLIPTPFKQRAGESGKPKSKEWNPATPYIILGLLVGSQAIQIIWLKQEQGRSMRKAEAKIGILKEVIERVQSGEDVDVEKVLGTGDAEEEKEWAEVLKDIKEEEVLFQSKKQRRARRRAAVEQEQKAQEIVAEAEKKDSVVDDSKVKVETVNSAKFY